MVLSRLPTRLMATFLLRPHGRRTALAVLGRPFTSQARLRLAIYGDPNRITFAQIYPFLHHAQDLWALHGLQIRIFPFEHLLQKPELPACDIALIAPWFSIGPDRLSQALDRLEAPQPAPEISFIDSYAHNDLRFARVLEGRIRFYFKKSLFRDRRRFLAEHRGTALQDYYGGLYGIDHPLSDWRVPERFLQTLRLSPGFFHANHLAPRFRPAGPPGRDRRRFDLHLRLETRGEPWYQAMRQDALRHGLALRGLRLTGHERVGNRLYTSEMRQSRLCFSPFGYGEVCWRDAEAFAAGAVLVKPDMSHLETLPERFVPGETYLPVRWDFSDLEEVVTAALSDPERCETIARTAYQRIAGYMAEKRFLQDVACLFEAGPALTCTR